MPSFYGYIPTPRTGVAEYVPQNYTSTVLNQVATTGNVAFTPGLRTQLLAEWHRWHSGSIVVADAGVKSAKARKLVSWVVARPPVMTHGVALWLHVDNTT